MSSMNAYVREVSLDLLLEKKLAAKGSLYQKAKEDIGESKQSM